MPIRVFYHLIKKIGQRTHWEFYDSELIPSSVFEISHPTYLEKYGRSVDLGLSLCGTMLKCISMMAFFCKMVLQPQGRLKSMSKSIGKCGKDHGISEIKE